MRRCGGLRGDDGVAWVRASYRPEAVETADQEEWVEWFAEWVEAHPEASASHAGLG